VQWFSGTRPSIDQSVIFIENRISDLSDNPFTEFELLLLQAGARLGRETPISPLAQIVRVPDCTVYDGGLAMPIFTEGQTP
jgi:hypothetical protein